MTRIRKHVAVALALACLASACGGTPAPSATTQPTPSPAATVTPAPSPSPTPTATPAPTPVPAPTMTVDDVKIDGIVKDGVAAMLALSNEVSGAATLDDTVAVIEKMKSLAETQATLTGIYTASPCTKDAWDLYAQGMGQMSSGADAVLAWVAAGAGDTMPADDVSASATTLGSAIAALKAGCPGAAAFGGASSEPTAVGGGYAAVLEALDTPGTVMTGGTGSTGVTPHLFSSMWTLRALAIGASGFGWEFGTLPKPKADAAGNPVVRVTLNKTLPTDAVMVLNGDGTLRAVAVTTPSGGYGGTAPYLSVDVLYGLFAETLRPGAGLDPVSALGLPNGATRVGMDESSDLDGLHFRFVGTADHGDWLIATAAP